MNTQTSFNNLTRHRLEAACTCFKCEEVLVQLFAEKRNEWLHMGLPIKTSSLPKDSYGENGVRDEEDNGLHIVDQNSGTKYKLMELDSNGFYRIDGGQEIRIRVKNKTAQPKSIHLSILLQDSNGCYHALFPNFVPNIQSFPNNFRMIQPDQETIIAIPSNKLPGISRAYSVNELSSQQKPFRLIVIATVHRCYLNLLQALKKRISPYRNSNVNAIKTDHHGNSPSSTGVSLPLGCREKTSQEETDGVAIFTYQFRESGG